jgi:NADH:ubiquinone oxidoreductase subunit F (NADH-binding)
MTELAARQIAPPAGATLRLYADPAARLLAGPGEPAAESLTSHEQRLGPLPSLAPGHADHVVDLADAAGLVGRGGGEFPLARKLRAAIAAPGVPVVVANGSESEPASRKDRLLLERRPHLVLDGAVLAAAAVGARQVFVYVHAEREAVVASLMNAVRERRGLAEARGEANIVVTTGPAGFVTGESSAVVSALSGHAAVPRPRATPAAVSGIHGRPTVVSNVETLAHLALLVRFGADWFRTAGSAGTPGSSLVTLAGGVGHPGLVVEVLAPTRIGDLLTLWAGLRRPPAAVLIGGYGGRWVSGSAAWHAPLDRAQLKRTGVALGCGLIAPLPDDACGLAVTAALLDYLAGQSAGQCGSCVFGLPRLSEDLHAIVEGDATRGDVRRLHEAALTVNGRGGCAHPDGAVSLLETALEVFDDDLRKHLKGRHCGRGVRGWFPSGHAVARASAVGSIESSFPVYPVRQR